MSRMNTVQFGDTWFNIPSNGIMFTETELQLTVILDGTSIEDLEEMVGGNTDVINIYDENHQEKTGTFTGYSVLTSIIKEYDRQIDVDYRANCATMCLCEKSLEKRLLELEAQSLYTSMMTDTML